MIQYNTIQSAVLRGIVDLTTVMRTNAQLTEELAGGCCCCCCEEAVVVVLLGDSAFETVADTGTCATFICQKITELPISAQWTELIQPTSEYSINMWYTHLLNKSRTQYFLTHFVQIKCHFWLEILRCDKNWLELSQCGSTSTSHSTSHFRDEFF